jgi:hypothetical protein
MFIEHEQYRSSSPVDFIDRTPTSMGNDVYFDDGIPVSPKEQGRSSLKKHQHGKNPCKQMFRFIRSNYLFLILYKRIFFDSLKDFGQHNKRKKLIVKKIWIDMHEQPFVNLRFI